MLKHLGTSILFHFVFSTIYCQTDAEYFGTVGLNVGINRANETLSSDNINLTNDQIKARTTIQAGVVFQVKPYDGPGVGVDLGIMFNQKGYTYNNSIATENVEKPGYRLVNHFEAPLNVRYYYAIEGFSASVIVGMYAGYAANGESAATYYGTKEYIEFKDYKERFEYGYNLGFGLDALSFGLDFVWSRGLKNISYGYTAPYTSRNKMFSLVLRLMIPSD